VRRVLAECFPRWAAALRLLGSLAARSERLRLEWGRNGAVPALVALFRQGVDPTVKAAALDALSALALPLSGAEGGQVGGAAALSLGASADVAVAIWAALRPPPAHGAPAASPFGLSGAAVGVRQHHHALGHAHGDGYGAAAEEAEEDVDLVSGMAEDLSVEQRHQVYPQTRAFLRLLLTVTRAHSAAALPPPAGLARPLLWAADAIFARHDGFGFVSDAERWDVSAACLALMLEVAEAYDPATDEAHELPPRPAGWQPSAADLARFLVARPAAGGGGFGVALAPAAQWGANAAGYGEGVSYSLPELPAGLELLCAFAAPRSPLFHQLRLLLARASATLAAAPDAGAKRTGGYGEAGSAAAAAAHAPQVYRAAALGARLLELLLEKERPLRDKLRRMQAAHSAAETWGAWSDEQAERLRQLHAELWRALPAGGACALPHLLSEPLLLGAQPHEHEHPGSTAGFGAALPSGAPPRRSALAAAVLLLESAAADAPRGSGLRLSLACTGVLRRARAALGDRLAPLLRAEGALAALRRCLELLLEPAVEEALGVRRDAYGSGEAGEAGAAEADEGGDEWEGPLPQHLPPPPPRPPPSPPPFDALSPADAAADAAPCHEPAAAAGSPLAQLLLLLLDDLRRSAPPALAAAAPAPAALALLGLDAPRRGHAALGHGLGGSPADAFGGAYGGGEGYHGAPPPSSPGDASVLGEMLRLCGGGGGGAAFDELASEIALRICTHATAAPAALRALHASGALPPLLRTAAARLAPAAAQADASAAAEAAAWATNTPAGETDACVSALHGLGFRLRLAAAALAAATRPLAGAPPAAAAALAAAPAKALLHALLAPDEAEGSEPPLGLAARALVSLSRALVGRGAPLLPAGVPTDGRGYVVAQVNLRPKLHVLLVAQYKYYDY